MKIKITLMACLLALTAQSQDILLTEFAGGFVGPTEITHANDGRLFVSEVVGRVKIVNPDGTVEPQNFLSLPSNSLLVGGERGLLGLAFHPQYEDNGYFFISYTRAPDGAVVVARFSRNPANPNLALPDSGTEVIVVPHPLLDHNGGQIHFGPDGNLFIALGDGASPAENAQDYNVNLGKILRINVDNLPYTVPSDNPFVNNSGNDEIWAMGLRNPWKFSFDREDGSLWIADVGQSGFEEINYVQSTEPGHNFGWPCFEALSPYYNCDSDLSNFTSPVAYYAHDITSCSITGGYLYRGSQYPNLYGKYVFSDFCSNGIRVLNPQTGQIQESGVLLGDMPFLTTLGEDTNGELYVGSFAFGKVYKITDTALSNKVFETYNPILHPNPAHQQFAVQMPQHAYPATIRVTDLSGKTVLKQEVLQAQQEIATQILQTGTYIVKITTSNNQEMTRKLLVN